MTPSNSQSDGSRPVYDTQKLDIPNADGEVTVVGAARIFYKVMLDGKPLSRKRGAWQIPLRNGSTVTLRARGFIPGFQRLFVDGEEVLRMGAHVSMAERVAMFSPLLLLLFIYPGLAFVSLTLALLLFFMNIMAVKNPLMPRAVRLVLPFLNTVAGAFLLLMLPSLVGTTGA